MLALICHFIKHKTERLKYYIEIYVHNCSNCSKSNYISYKRSLEEFINVTQAHDGILLLWDLSGIGNLCKRENNQNIMINTIKYPKMKFCLEWKYFKTHFTENNTMEFHPLR